MSNEPTTTGFARPLAPDGSALYPGPEYLRDGARLGSAYEIAARADRLMAVVGRLLSAVDAVVTAQGKVDATMWDGTLQPVATDQDDPRCKRQDEIDNLFHVAKQEREAIGHPPGSDVFAERDAAQAELAENAQQDCERDVRYMSPTVTT